VVASLQAIRRPPIADSRDNTHKQYDISKGPFIATQLNSAELNSDLKVRRYKRAFKT